MAFKNNFIKDINEKLMEARTPDDIRVTLNIPEHKFKKIGEKFNYALNSVYNDHKDHNVKMFHILLSLQNYFDMQWLAENILDDENKKIIEEEMKTDFNIN